MMQKNFLKELLKSQATVFSFKELLIRFNSYDAKQLKSKLHYYVKRGDLHHIRRGLYAKDINYNRLELANKIYTPSYISFETVLLASGIIFQYYRQIFVATYQSREIVCDGTTYVFRTIHPLILTNAVGIEILENYSIASPERAFLDMVYLHKQYHFDNLEPINWYKVYEILPIYMDNKSMNKRVEMYHKYYMNSL